VTVISRMSRMRVAAVAAEVISLNVFNTTLTQTFPEAKLEDAFDNDNPDKEFCFSIFEDMIKEVRALRK
jgi:hypothetical protein